MRLSPLQKYILKICFNRGGTRVAREFFVDFYDASARPGPREQVKIITQSLERLIDREFLLGYGVRTAQKWFIRDVSLTPKGVKTARALISRQLQLKLK